MKKSLSGQPSAKEGEGSEYLSTTEAADAIGVCEKSIRRWTDAGKLKCIRTKGNHRRIPKSEIIRMQLLITSEKGQTDHRDDKDEVSTTSAAPEASALERPSHKEPDKDCSSQISLLPPRYHDSL